LLLDASFDEDTLQGTTGAIIRDNKGRFVAARNSKISAVYDVVTAEAMALKEGLLLADGMGCNRFIISSDSTEVIEANEE
jgi:ribonuclease HI